MFAPGSRSRSDYEAFPIGTSAYLTKKNQVRTGRSLIQGILARHGEVRLYASEGGRTTRATRTAAEKLVERLNGVAALGSDNQKRVAVADALQEWLVKGFGQYFARQRIIVEGDTIRQADSAYVVRDILNAVGSQRD